jgi:Peptidase family M28/Immune inhibitor A-like, MAM domain
MTIESRARLITSAIIAVVFLLAGATTASEESLIRIERRSDNDRNALIEAGITLVEETDDSFLAIGEPSALEAAAAARSLTVTTVDRNPGTGRYAMVGLRPGSTETDLLVCGEVMARGDDWRLIKGDHITTPECLESPGWFLRLLDLEPLAPVKPAPSEYAGLIDGTTQLIPNPLVQEMVNAIDTPFALAHWSALAQSTVWSTRHSSSQGCVDATVYVHDLFSSIGLGVEYQHHTGGYADNVIGTLVGETEPGKVYIAIGHIDDLPSSGAAPGADDNASGTAMVTAAADIMACYRFARTVKFIAVTGEEQGLYGSDHYADTAAAAGEDIQAVLNGDMIGWEGDGQPAVEDLDVNYNSGSQWLAQAMVDAAGEYGTGMAVNAFLCSSMVWSDHAPFWDHGFSATCGITDNENFCGYAGNYPFYHQSSDTIANCGPGGPDFEAAAIRTYVATLAHLAQPIARVVETPLGLQAQPDGANRVALSWLPQSAGSLVRIYRAPGGCSQPGPWVLVGETGLASFLDATASGSVPYAYRVVAEAAGGCVSPTSVCVETTTTGPCTEPPTFAGVLDVVNAAASTCRLTLDWQPPEQVWCGGPVAYNVYRSIDPGFAPSLANRIAGQVVATSFDDLDVVSGEVLHYLVRAVDLAHGGEDDNTVKIAGSPSGPVAVGAWTDNAGDSGTADLQPTSPWHVAAGEGVSGAAYATGTYGNNLCAGLTTPTLLLDTNPQLEFWSKYDLENTWDKGELQISTDGGSLWHRVSMTYPGASTNTNDQCGLGTGSFFTGDQSTYSAFTADLSPWTGQEATLRWVLSSDGLQVGDGWWIDEISITDVAVPGSCSGSEQLFSDGFESGTTTAWSN